MESELAAMKAEIAAMRADLSKLQTEAAIRDVLRRYARGLDRHDVELESSAFWPDAQVNYGFYSGRRDAFVQWGNEGHEARYVRHEHHLTTQSIDIEGDVAHVETYVIYMLRGKDEQHTNIGGARYVDRLERRNGEWRIAMREFVPDIMVQTNSIFAGEFSDRMCAYTGGGTWDKTDLSYKRPLTLRPEK
jgi:hypothetical protein